MLTRSPSDMGCRGRREGRKKGRKNSVARRRKQLLEDWKRICLLLLTPNLQLQESASKCLERTHGMEGRISLLQVVWWGHAYSLLLFFFFCLCLEFLVLFRSRLLLTYSPQALYCFILLLLLLLLLLKSSKKEAKN